MFTPHPIEVRRRVKYLVQPVYWNDKCNLLYFRGDFHACDVTIGLPREVWVLSMRDKECEHMGLRYGKAETEIRKKKFKIFIDGLYQWRDDVTVRWHR